MLRQLGGALPRQEPRRETGSRTWRSKRRDTAAQQAVAAQAPAQVAHEEPQSRFQPGALRPVVDSAGSNGGHAHRERKAWRWFDRALLAAEVVSALVVAWLVAQYIYTAYIDTTPHRPNAGRPVPQGAARQTPRATATRTATLTLTPTSTATPAPEAGDSWRGPAGWPGFEGAADTSSATPTATPTGVPTATPTVDPALLLPVRLRIPVMFLDSPVHEVKVNMGTWEVSPLDVGHHEGSGNPGETGNVVLAAHRDINSALFRDLDRLQPGDEVFVSNGLREYRYIVNDSFVVSPSHTEVMDPTDDKRLTLITCTPIGLATQRLIVTAILDEAPGTP